MLRCAQPPRSNVLLKYASARRFIARLASGTFLTRLRTGFFSTLLVGLLAAPFLFAFATALWAATQSGAEPQGRVLDLIFRVEDLAGKVQDLRVK